MNTNKKKNLILLLIIFFSTYAMAQEKGSYLSITGGMGPSGLNYQMENINFATPKTKIKTGSQLGIGYSYYFNKYVGISTGIGFGDYRTQAQLIGNFQPDKYLVLGNYTDPDLMGYVNDYELRVRTQNWKEEQNVSYFQIPLTFNLQKKFGAGEHFGLYMAVGAKFHLPVSAWYAVSDGKNPDDSKLLVSGYYEEKNLELGALGAPDVSQYGFGTIHNPSEVLSAYNNGKLNMKYNISLIGEVGFLVSLSRRVDISLGAFVDYGLLNINNKGKESMPLFTGPETDYVEQANNGNVGKGITYKSVTNSEYVNHINTISYGGKVGVRVKLGKLSAKQNSESQLAREIFQPPTLIHDTIYVVEKQSVNLDSLVKKMKEAIGDVDKKTTEVVAHKKIEKEEEKLDYYPGVYPEEETNLLFEPIYFDLNKSSLKPESIKNLDKKVSILKKYRDIQLIIFGNTCDIGNDPYNFQLGYKRAEAAKNYMVSKGIAKERLQISTMSKFDPELPNINEDNRTHNRRDDFKPIFSRLR